MCERKGWPPVMDWDGGCDAGNLGTPGIRAFLVGSLSPALFGGPTPGRVTPESATPGRAMLGRATPGRVTPGRATPGRATPAIRSDRVGSLSPVLFGGPSSPLQKRHAEARRVAAILLPGPEALDV